MTRFFRRNNNNNSNNNNGSAAPPNRWSCFRPSTILIALLSLLVVWQQQQQQQQQSGRPYHQGQQQQVTSQQRISHHDKDSSSSSSSSSLAPDETMTTRSNSERRNSNRRNSKDGNKLHQNLFPKFPPSKKQSSSSACYYRWGDDDFVRQVLQTNASNTVDNASNSNDNSNSNNNKQLSLIPWTVAGGPEYRHYLPTLLRHWRHDLGIPLMVVALDEATAQAACTVDTNDNDNSNIDNNNNPITILWHASAVSYSRVADAKFQVAAALAQAGHWQFFVELDVFCNESPLQALEVYDIMLQQPQREQQGKEKAQQEHSISNTHANPNQHYNFPPDQAQPAAWTPNPHHADLMLMGHATTLKRINIGLYIVKPSIQTARFFQALTRALGPSLSPTEKCIKVEVEGTTTSRNTASNNHNNAPSKTETELGGFFDQDMFDYCLHAPEQAGISLYAKSDIARQHDLLQPCKELWGMTTGTTGTAVNEKDPNATTTTTLTTTPSAQPLPQSLRYHLISNLKISSYMPPSVYDTTICIHPLAIRPFSSFHVKLTTAKFWGFDPEPLQIASYGSGDEENDNGDDKHHNHDSPPLLLKTDSGDFAFIEGPGRAWCAGFFAVFWPRDETTDSVGAKEEVLQDYLAKPLAALIYLTIQTNRTLVLPKYLRDCEGRSYPLINLVNTASVERALQGRPWRFLSGTEARDLRDETTTAQLFINTTGTLGRTSSNNDASSTTTLRPSWPQVAQQVKDQCDNHSVRACALSGLWRMAWNDGQGLGNRAAPDPELQDILKQLSFCRRVSKKHGTPPPFVHNTGSFNCEEGGGTVYQ